MKKAYCLLNHSLTDNQIKELVEEYNISEIKSPDAELSAKWMQIPASKNLDMNVIKEIYCFMLCIYYCLFLLFTLLMDLRLALIGYRILSYHSGYLWLLLMQ